MGIVSGIVTFLVIWWVVLFLVLPIGVKISRKKKRPSYASSAPDRFSWKRTFMYTTLVSIMIFIMFWFFQAELSEWVFSNHGVFAINMDISN